MGQFEPLANAPTLFSFGALPDHFDRGSADGTGEGSDRFCNAGGRRLGEPIILPVNGDAVISRVARIMLEEKRRPNHCDCGSDNEPSEDPPKARTAENCLVVHGFLVLRAAQPCDKPFNSCGLPFARRNSHRVVQIIPMSASATT